MEAIVYAVVFLPFMASQAQTQALLSHLPAFITKRSY